ncbi:type I restriction-modification system subunit M [Weeksellaceae bacterium TAE3-ERU29]|nr:type I restriction-modification system subunit M [Weeksellaceae bacterium TAE3-ERU29]
MLTSELKSKIDKVWLAFHSGGLTNPLQVIEQITYLLFIKRLDELQFQKEQLASLTETPIEKPIYEEYEYHLRWSKVKELSPEKIFELFTRQPDGVFQFMKNYGSKSASFNKFMKGATFMIPTPRLLTQVIEMLEDIPMEDQDTKGNVYEYLLSKIQSSGTNGQFRTPRHIIKMMVELMQPSPTDIICDPSVGSCGFLLGAVDYLRTHYQTELYKTETQKHFQNQMFLGMEFDPTMIRIGAMNMILHGIENPQLLDVDSLSEENSNFTNKATLILANPPFKGSLDYDAVDDSILQIVKSKKTELLFLGLMIRGLQKGGRCAVIVPDGVLFGSSNAHKNIRKELVENQILEAVISMPSGVFKPYAGVSTAVLVFTKTDNGGTDKVWFYDMQSDGFSLDDKRNPIEENDIPDIIERYHNRKEESETQRAKTEKSFVVDKKEIADNGYDLSINRYKEIVYEKVIYQTPTEIISQINALDKERGILLEELKKLL